MAIGGPPDDRAVFLNVPFDSGYEDLFIAVIAVLVSIGRIPRTVLEVSESGQGRLPRILQQLESCKVSIHDLSRVGGPARFNMPFELGLAYFMRRVHYEETRYHFVVFESERYRLSRTLSDLAGHDPVIHYGKPLGVITAVLDSLGSRGTDPTPRAVHNLWKRLMKVSRSLKAQAGREDVFSRTMFNRLVAAATQLAVDEGMIVP